MAHSLLARVLPALGLAVVLGAAPGGSAQEPAASAQEPAASTQEPAASAQEPAASAQEPAPSAQAPAATRGWVFETAVGLEVLGGHTTYRIEASEGPDSIASELEFPLSGFTARLQAELASGGRPGAGRAVLRVAGLKSLAGSGTMKDSDWLSDSLDIAEVGAPNAGKDIYSESDAELDALAFEGSAAWEFHPARRLTFGPMVGVLYQRFEYDVSNVRQVGYGSYAADYTGDVLGKALEYRVSYLAPYLGARAALATGRLTATADAWFSPSTSAEDRDDHLLRGKLSTTRADGSAWQASVGASLVVGRQDFVQVQAATTRVRATGMQRQRFYAGPDAGLELYIDSTITSARSSLFFAFVHRF